MIGVPAWLQDLVKNSLPEAVGGLLAAGTGAVLAGLWAKRTRARRSSRALVKRLVPEHLNRFEFGKLTARTTDDDASLALVSALIKHKAKDQIEVIGRGSQWAERRTSDYMRAVTEAIVRGVAYDRILLLDAELPENGLSWLLLLERFIATPAFKGSVRLYPVPVQARGMTHQFQLIDDTYLHRTNRQYSPKEAVAGKRAQSLFAIGPHPDVAEYRSVFREYVAKQPGPVSHRDLAELIERLLATIDPTDYSVPFRWQLVLGVLRFVDQLGVLGLPGRGIELVGALSPFTFTYQAARRFTAARRGEAAGRPAVVVPFESFDEAKREFERGTLDHICLPVKNSKIDYLSPPLLDEEALRRFQAAYVVRAEIDVEVAFVLAGTAPNAASAKSMACVDAARLQVESQLPPKVAGLAPPRDTVRSNYHAGWLAARSPDTIAITTPEAADFFGLRTYRSLKGGTTSFSIFSRHAG
ncbi:MAG: hypothetical protein HOP28_08420 [Gemmatimonadales bacterium]|nr:hypothetical protein [Gemmatimonadales bacterium]